HVDAVDLGDLLDEQLEQLIGGQLDHQLVDGAAGTPFEDVDADHVTPDGADAAGDGAQGAGPVGEPHPGHVLLHTRTVRVPYERRVSRPRNADYGAEGGRFRTSAASPAWAGCRRRRPGSSGRPSPS